MFAVKLLLICAKTKRAIKKIPGRIRSVRIRKFTETAKKKLKRNPVRHDTSWIEERGYMFITIHDSTTAAEESPIKNGLALTSQCWRRCNVQQTKSFFGRRRFSTWRLWSPVDIPEDFSTYFKQTFVMV